MASFLQRALGKSKKENEKKAADIQATTLVVQEDDLFSGMKISGTSPPAFSTAKNIEDLQDLDLSLTIQNKNEDHSTDTSAFSFLNEGDAETNIDNSQLNTTAENTSFQLLDNSIEESNRIEDYKNEILQTTDKSQMDTTATCEQLKSSEKVVTVKHRKKPVKKPKIKVVRRPGFANQSISSSSEALKIKDDSASLSSVDSESVHSLELLDEEIGSSNTTIQASTIGESRTENEKDAAEITIIDSQCINTTVDSTNSHGKAVNSNSEQCINTTVVSTNSHGEAVNSNSEQRINTTVDSTNSHGKVLNCNSEEHEYTEKATSEDYSQVNNDTISSTELNLPKEKVYNTSPEINLDSTKNANDLKDEQDEEDDNKDYLAEDKKIYQINLTEENQLVLTIEGLKFQQERLKSELEMLLSHQRELIENWKAEHLSEKDIHEKINTLREKQNLFEASEEYDKAADIDQQISDLLEMSEKFKYQHPILDETLINSVNNFNETLVTQQQEKENIKKQYEKILETQKSEMVDMEDHKTKLLDAETLQVKEEQLKLERSLSHTKLDKEHLLKTKTVLEETIFEQTKTLQDDKEKLVEERTLVQEEIADLREKLKNLLDKEEQYTENIKDTKSKIDAIVLEYQPKMNTIIQETDVIVQEELKLDMQWQEINERKSAIEKLKEDIHNEKKRKRQLLEELEEYVKRNNGSLSTSIFSFEEIIDIDPIKSLSHVESSKLKNLLKEKKAYLQTIVNEILGEQRLQKNLQRSLNDLETHLSELQKTKTVAVKGRNYKEAKRISEEIISLTKEGEEKQKKVLLLSDSIKSSELQVTNSETDIKSLEEQFKLLETENDKLIIDSLIKLKMDIENFLESYPHNSNEKDFIWNILQLELDHCGSIMENLHLKHGSFMTNTEFDINAIQDEVEELENLLQIAEIEEDYEQADKLHTSILEKKKLLTSKS